MLDMGRSAKQNRRYYLHQKIKEAYKYNAVGKTIFIPYDQNPTDKAVLELRNKFNYSLQTEIQ